MKKSGLIFFLFLGILQASFSQEANDSINYYLTDQTVSSRVVLKANLLALGNGELMPIFEALPDNRVSWIVGAGPVLPVYTGDLVIDDRMPIPEAIKIGYSIRGGLNLNLASENYRYVRASYPIYYRRRHYFMNGLLGTSNLVFHDIGTGVGFSIFYRRFSLEMEAIIAARLSRAWENGGGRSAQKSPIVLVTLQPGIRLKKNENKH